MSTIDVLAAIAAKLYFKKIRSYIEHPGYICVPHEGGAFNFGFANDTFGWNKVTEDGGDVLFSGEFENTSEQTDPETLATLAINKICEVGQ